MAVIYDLYRGFSPSTQRPIHWLMLGILALAVSGIFSVILVVARTPGLASMELFQQLFHVSLVIHVDLSVLVWFLAIIGMCWAILRDRLAQPGLPYFDGAALGCVALGIVAMAFSPLSPEWETIKSNYIPVITNPVFFMSLGLIASGVLIALLNTAYVVIAKMSELRPLDWGIAGTLSITLIAGLCFLASFGGIESRDPLYDFYEYGFWAGGHVLQFAYVQANMVAWLVLISAVSGAFFLKEKWLLSLFALGPIIVLASFYPYLRYEVLDPLHARYFSNMMAVPLGVAPGILALCIGWQLRSRLKPRKATRGLWSALVASLVLFAVGGAFGALIDGQNVKIPAHYHGSIVSVTLAFMGLAYYLLPRFGYQAVAHTRMAFIQPLLYGFGQLLHITGLAVSGGYGVLRKTPGEVTDAARAAMGVMGLGGLLAIIGGLLFVVVMLKALMRGRSAK